MMSDEQDKEVNEINIDKIEFSPAGSNEETKNNAENKTDLGAELEEMSVSDTAIDESNSSKTAEDLEAVFDVPVRVSVVLGKAKMPISSLLAMDVGTVVELDRQVGEAIDIHVNDRLVARGEIVLVEDRLGVTMTEIIKTT